MSNLREEDTSNQPIEEKSKSVSQEKIQKQEIKNDNEEKEDNTSEKLILNLCITDSENADVWEKMGINLWKDFDDPSTGSENIPACESIEVEVLEKRNVNDVEKYKIKYGQVEGWITKRLLIDEKIGSKEKSSISHCENATDYIIQKIESGLNTKDIFLRNAKIIKSNDFESVYFISADLQGAGLEEGLDIATFATNKLDYSGLVFSVNHVAEEFSDWGVGSKTDFNITMSDDGAQESYSCVSEMSK